MSYFDHVIYKATQVAADWPHMTQWTTRSCHNAIQTFCLAHRLGSWTTALRGLPCAGKDSQVRRN
jgi:hypothetical protein